MVQAGNVCSDFVIHAKEVEHLGKVLHYNNYPQWLIEKWGKSDKSGSLLHPDIGHEIKKQSYVSIPYFPGLNESFKKIFKYTAMQVCVKGSTHSSPCSYTPKTRSPQTRRRIVSTTGNARQMGVSPYMSERHPGLLDRGSRNTASPAPQPYSNTVLIFTTPYQLSPSST